MCWQRNGTKKPTPPPHPNPRLKTILKTKARADLLNWGSHTSTSRREAFEALGRAGAGRKTPPVMRWKVGKWSQHEGGARSKSAVYRDSIKTLRNCTGQHAVVIYVGICPCSIWSSYITHLSADRDRPAGLGAPTLGGFALC